MNDASDLTGRELFCKAMRFECPGRTLATLGGIWPSAIERWREEGMPRHLSGVTDLIDHFSLQRHMWSGPAVSVWVWPPFPREVFDETDDKITYRNPSGIVCTEFKEDNYKSMPHFESFPVADRDDWRSFRERLRWDDARVSDRWAEQKARWSRRTDPLILYLDRAGSLYGSLRDMMGMERLSMAFYDDPEMVGEMMDAVVELFCDLCDAILTDFTPDAVCLWEDMAYKTASLVAPPVVREFMLPRYRTMVAKLREKGVPFILLDSDGHVAELIPIWLEAGIDGLVPMEAQAGMDVAEYREKYPELLMLGGVDKKAVAAGGAAIDAELERIRPVFEQGGFIPHLDHLVPPDISLDSYRRYLDRKRKLIGK